MPYLTSLQAIQVFTTAGCSFCAFFLTGFFCWSIWHTLQEGIRYLRRLHQVPCDRCQYFTGEHLLKCTVHPCKAFSEEAINCLDFAPILQPTMLTPKFERCKYNCLKQ